MAAQIPRSMIPVLLDLLTIFFIAAGFASTCVCGIAKKLNLTPMQLPTWVPYLTVESHVVRAFSCFAKSDRIKSSISAAARGERTFHDVVAYRMRPRSAISTLEQLDASKLRWS